jgi:predicted MFS family arabinose efflux permease
VFAVGEFRALWTAHALSVAGDQLARVALTVLVFDRTHSPAWTALTYALTFLPDLVGGPLLSGFADRFPRRWVMVAADLVRAALVAVMALPGQSVVALIVLLAIAQLLASPFAAARGAIMPAILPGDRLVVGTGVMSTTYQLALVGGFGGGAAVVATLGIRDALLVDAATFVASAALVCAGVRAHRPPPAGTGSRRTWWGTLTAGFAVVMSDRRLRTLIGLACVSGAYIVPEGLAVPYAAQIHGGTQAVGWLLAANPAGTVVGVLAVKNFRPERRLTLLAPLAVVTCAVLLPTGLAPTLAVSVLLWFASGVGSAYNTIAQAAFVRVVPDHARGQAGGLASSSLRVAQGVGVLAAGLLAEAFTPARVIAIAALVGVVLAVVTGLAWHRAVAPATGGVRPAAGQST